MDNDLQSKSLTANGYIVQGPARVTCVSVYSLTAGVLTLRDGGAAGTIKMEIGYNAGGTVTIPLAPDAIRFSIDVYLSATAFDRATVFWA